MTRLIRLYYGFQIFFSLLLWIPIFYEYQKRIGLNDAEIFRIQSIYYVAFCLLEIPTGLLADSWGYRSCLRLGAIVLVVSNLMPVIVPGYDSFLVHFLLIALARSLTSGASSAYLYDAMISSGAGPAEYKRVEGNSRAYGLIAKVLIWPFIGVLMEWHLSLPYLLTVFGAGVAVVCAWLLPTDVRWGRSPGGTPGVVPGLRMLTEIASVLQALPRMPILPLLMVQGLAAFILPRILQTNLFQPILEMKGFSVSSYGLLLAGASVFEALGSGYPAMRVALSRLSEWSAVSLLSALMAVSLALIPFSWGLGTVGCLMAFSLSAGMIFPVQKQLMNDAISLFPEVSKYRATLLSVESIFDRAVCAWVVSWIGVFASTGRIDEFLWISAAVCFVGVVLFSAFSRGILSNVLAKRVSGIHD